MHETAGMNGKPADKTQIIRYIDGVIKVAARGIGSGYYAQPLVSLRNLEPVLAQYKHMAPSEFDRRLLSAWQHEIDACNLAISGAKEKAHREADFEIGVAAPQYDAVQDYRGRIDWLRRRITELEQASQNGHQH